MKIISAILFLGSVQIAFAQLYAPGAVLGTTNSATNNVGVGIANPNYRFTVAGGDVKAFSFDNNTGISMGAENAERPRIGFHVSDNNRRFKIEFNGVNQSSERLGINLNGAFIYTASWGSSIAAPMVAGLAALILSVKPDLSPDEVEFIMKSTAVNVDNLPGNEVYAGLAGGGRIDAYAAVLKTYNCFACEDIYYLPEQIPDEIPFIPADAQGCKIEISNHVTFSYETYVVKATKEIRILPGFTALQGCNVQFKINEVCIVPSSSGARRRTSEIQHVSYRDLIESGKIQIPEPGELSVEETSGWEDGLGIYPNPTKDRTIIKYNLEQSFHVKLQLHNVTGNSIETIIDGFQEEGQREVSHNVSEIAPGIYYYLLETNRVRKLVRFVVIH